MSAALVGGQRQFTPRVWASAVDPTNAAKAATGYLLGDIWINTATLNEFRLVDQANGRWRHVPRVLGQGGPGTTLTGTTNETAAATVAVPANAMGVHGMLDIVTYWDWTNSANGKTVRFRLGGLAGTSLYRIGVGLTANTLVASCVGFIKNNGAANAQVALPDASLLFANVSTLALQTGAVDTTAAQDLVISGQLANSGESQTLRFYRVTLTRPDIA